MKQFKSKILWKHSEQTLFNCSVIKARVFSLIAVPPKVSVPKGQLAIRKGEAARLVCDVTGNGPINVKWVKKQNVIEIHPGSR